MSSDHRTGPPSPIPAPSHRPNPVVTALLVILGIILLLPGLCTLYFVREFTRADGVSALLDLTKGDPIANLFLIVWGGSIVISLFGVWLLRRAWRRGSA